MFLPTDAALSARSGDAIRVGDANLVGGGFRTPAATVYLLDRVLTPP